MIAAIHQPNFCPWFPFFYKMAMADKFIILNNVQFEKNGYQNRFRYKDKWVTKSIMNDSMHTKIIDKKYATGRSLNDLNMSWINVIKDTLEIDTEIVFSQYNKPCSPTERLIHEIKLAGCDTYLTNPDAKNKYLDENIMNYNGIDVKYCKVPAHLNKHTFEILEEFGIDGAIKQLKGLNEKSTSVLQLSK